MSALRALDQTERGPDTGRVVDSTLVEGAVVNPGDVLVRLEDAELRATSAQARAEAAAVRQPRAHEV